MTCTKVALNHSLLSCKDFAHRDANTNITPIHLWFMSECFLECIYLFCHPTNCACTDYGGIQSRKCHRGNVDTALGGDGEEEGGTRVLTIEDKEG